MGSTHRERADREVEHFFDLRVTLRERADEHRHEGCEESAVTYADVFPVLVKVPSMGHFSLLV